MIRSSALLSVFLVCAAAAPAAPVADLSRDGVDIRLDATPAKIDPARDLYLTVTVTTPAGIAARIPDLRDRFGGFAVAEDFSDEPVTSDGKTTTVTKWRLVPEPAARRYRLAPFVVTKTAADGSVTTFPTTAVTFAPPDPRPPVTGGVEVSPRRDREPITWARVALGVGIVLGALALAAILFLLGRRIKWIVHEHRLSPVERAFVELDRLLKRRLPSKGLYKDFYVELTMVVRRYIERAHGVHAPELTTGEFLRAAEESPAFTKTSITELKAFLESADLVKFAGLEVTPAMADGATGRAKNYLSTDATPQGAVPAKGGAR